MKKQADKQEKLVIQSKPPVQPKPWSEIEKLAKAASVHIDIGFGGTGVLLKGGLLLTAKHVSKGRVSFRAKTYSRDWLDATLVAEHPGIGKDAVDLSLYKIQRPSAKLPFLFLSAEPLVSGQKLLTVEAEYTDWIVRTGELCQLSTKMQPWEFDCSVPVENGNSGGAAVNEHGEVVGIFVNITSVGIQRGSVRESVPGGEAINLQHLSVSEWLKKWV